MIKEQLEMKRDILITADSKFIWASAQAFKDERTQRGCWKLTAWGIHTSFQIISVMQGNVYDHSIHWELDHPFSSKFARSTLWRL